MSELDFALAVCLYYPLVLFLVPILSTSDTKTAFWLGSFVSVSFQCLFIGNLMIEGVLF